MKPGLTALEMLTIQGDIYRVLHHIERAKEQEEDTDEVLEGIEQILHGTLTIFEEEPNSGQKGTKQSSLQSIGQVYLHGGGVSF